MDASELQQRLSKAMRPTADDGAPQPAIRAATPGIPSAVSADLLQPPARLARLVSLMLIITVLAGLVWAQAAIIEEVTVGNGRVIPASKVQLVQNLEGGIISEVFAKDGAQVSKGDLLLRIDPTGANSSLEELSERAVGLKLEIARLTAELKNEAPVFDKALQASHPALVSQQLNLFRTRTEEVRAALSALELQASQKRQEILEARAKRESLSSSLEIAREESKLIDGLAKNGVAARTEVLTARARLTDLTGQLAAVTLSLPRLESALKELIDKKKEKASGFRAQSLAKLYESRVKLLSINQQMKADADKVSRTGVRSPVDGIIKTIHTTTIGQVVKPGENLVEIVPLNDSLLVEARVSPRDIAFLSPGQRAVVKITAYDYSLYGSLEGRLERIGADSVITDKGEAYYLVQVRTDTRNLERAGQSLPIKPGMVAQVDIVTGEKSVINYLTKPLHRMANESFRER